MAIDATEMTAATAQGTEAATQAEATPTAEQQPASAVDIWAELAKLDPDEVIRRDPRLQGKVGSLAQQQAQAHAQRIQQQYDEQLSNLRSTEAEAARRNNLKRLASEDPDALAREVQTDLARREYQEEQTRLLEAQRNEMGRAIAEKLDKFTQKPSFREAWEHASPEDRAKMHWPNYQEMDDFFEAAAEVISEYRSEKKAADKAEKLAEKRWEAFQKERTAEAAKADGAGTDLNLDGLSSSGHTFTVAEIQGMSQTQYKANAQAIREQYRAGLIR